MTHEKCVSNVNEGEGVVVDIQQWNGMKMKTVVVFGWCCGGWLPADSLFTAESN